MVYTEIIQNIAFEKDSVVYSETINRNIKSKNVYLQTTILLLLCFISTSYARYITIDSSLQTRIEGDVLNVFVEITNNGDEFAYDVFIHAEVGDQSKVSNMKKELRIKESFQTNFTFQLSFKKSGNYPVFIKINYSDLNKYSFSALSMTHINYKENVYPQIFGKMENVEIVKEGKARLLLKNLDEQKKAVDIRLILPKELSSPENMKKVMLQPKEEKSLVFTISNFSAFVGTKTAIYVIMEYENNQTHFSTSLMSSAEIIEKRKLTDKERLLLLGIPIFLFAVFFSISIYRRKRKKKI
jgi:hypothetical protein